MDIFTIFIYIVMFFLGYIYREFILFKDLMRISKNIKENPKLAMYLQENDGNEEPSSEENTEKPVYRLRYEVINNIHYFYMEDTNEFICQGASLKEAAQNYTYRQGKNTVGVFLHKETESILCFNDNECISCSSNV